MSGNKKISFKQKEELDVIRREAFRTLKTSVQFCGEDVKVIALTSCIPEEGTADVTVHLAEALAEDGNRVLCVDGNLRNAELTGLFDAKKEEAGLSEFLMGKAELDKIVNETETAGLDLVLAGERSSNPSGMLNGKRYVEFINGVRQKYDYVLISTPAAGAVSDCMIAARQTDGVVMVVGNKQVSYKFAQKVKQQLERSNVPILGAVLNKVPLGKKIRSAAEAQQ